MKKILLPVFTAIILVSCKEESKQDWYEFTGKVNNVPDSSMVYLSGENGNIDSTLVLGEIFRFTGKVDKPTEVNLYLKGSRDHAYIYLENSKMSFIADEGNFSGGKTTGSQAQREDDIYMKRMEPVDKLYESISPHLYEKKLSTSTRDSLLVITDSLRQERHKISQQFIKDYPNSYTSIKNLDGYKFAWGKKTTQELYSLMNQEHRESEKGQNIAKFIEVNVSPQVGDQYVDFELNNVKGDPVKLSNSMGKYTLIEFWASWCAPCRNFNPEMVKDYARFKDEGFVVYAVSLNDEKEPWIKAIKEDGLLWENVSDLKGRETKAAHIYGVNGIPDNFLIDENGTIIARKLRGESLTQKLEELFADNQITASE